VTRPNRGEIVIAALRIVAVFVALVAVYVSAPIGERPVGSVAARLLLGLVVVVVVLAWQIRSVTRSPHPTMRAVETVAVTAPLLVLIFASAYFAVGHNMPDSFSEELSRLDAVYFAVTVLASVGFGDIAARSEVARAMVTGQMIIDLVLVGLVAKVLLETVRRRRDVLDGTRGADPEFSPPRESG
jgi:hypothetical protein